MTTSNKLWISHKAKLLGYKLIKELNVGMGFGIASYLGRVINYLEENHLVPIILL